MALKLRKDIKKSSYYVWFLGAKESKGLRGTDFILPVIRHLEEREKDIEPFKVTLQVSHKGLKIIQNIVGGGTSGGKHQKKNETIKHFIPHNTITCVYQHEDIIACILLLFNPVTKCPLHVHAYRCDSLETASLLKHQLQTLIERPDNQKKFAEIENRLHRNKQQQQHQPIKKVESLSLSSSDTTRESESSSEERFSGIENSRVTTLYDSVAAELRQKLSKNNVPILLPPRDYDTVHRAKGNLTGIELRRCLNANIVGQNVQQQQTKGRRLESSGGSSGIGSDHPPSPDSPDTRFNTLDNRSTTDDEEEIEEDWSIPNQYLPQPPITRRTYLENPLTNNRLNTRSSRTNYFDDGFDEYRRRRPSPSPPPPPVSPRDRFQDAKEKFLLMERCSSANEAPIAPITKVKRHESMMMACSSDNNNLIRPKPAPRRFGMVQEENIHRKHCADIAKELKRRSYMEERPSSIHTKNYNNNNNRHSYAEPSSVMKKQMEMSTTTKKKHFEVCRTNSVSTNNNNGGARVGIASLHPY